MFQDAYDLIWLVLFLPLAGAIVQALCGAAVVRALGPARGKKVMGYAAVLPVVAGFGIGAVLTMSLMQLPPASRAFPARELFDWIGLQSVRVPFEVVIDPLSMTMVLIITGVGGLIHLYATGYMAEDRDYTRFFTYFNLFIAAMLILVLGGNFALMFIGWEGVGLCSYLLIAFWYKDPYNARAGNKAFIVNRIGDWGMTLGILVLMAVVVGAYGNEPGMDPRWLSYDVVLPKAVALLKNEPTLAAVIALLFFVGACGKSAQFPLHFWLPDAMAGPTPVSALIHAATMVTAGVFMLNRLHVLFELSPLAMGVVAVIGAFTALFAALVAFGQTDIKRVLAYSTISQLGFMFVACGVGAYWAGMFHVTTHAFFKALLFLGSGAVIAAMAHEQDMRRYGNLMKYLKVTAATMIVGWLAIAGIPPLAGFFSKEAILGGALGNEVAFIGGMAVGPPAGWILLVVAMLTAGYMTRLTWLTFFGGQERWRLIAPAHGSHTANPASRSNEAHSAPISSFAPENDPHGFFHSHEELRSLEEHEHHHELGPEHEPKEAGPSMTVPLVALAALSVVGGLALNPVFKEWLYPKGLLLIPDELVPGEPHFLSHSALIALSVVAALLGIVYGWAVYRRGLPHREGEDESQWSGFRLWAKRQFGYDDAVMEMGVGGGGSFADWLWRRFDAGIVDGLFNGVAWLTAQIGHGVRAFQTGFVRFYALIMLLGGLAILVSLWYFVARVGGAG